MSLIRVRRRRKKSWVDSRKGMPVGKLFFLLVITIAIIWFASNGTLAEIIESF